MKRIIDSDKLAQLIMDSCKLQCLEEAGVDNWIGYDYALNDTENSEYYKELLSKSAEEITKYYEY